MNGEKRVRTTSADRPTTGPEGKGRQTSPY
jgi:hypothetical protein